MKIHPRTFAVLFAAVTFLILCVSSVRPQEEYDPNEQDYGQAEGPGQEESPEEIKEARHKHILRILNPAYKAAWDEINKFDAGEREEAFKATEAADKAFADSKWSDEKLREEKDKARARWEKANRRYDELRRTLIDAESAASREYYRLPESLRRALENPLGHTPTFSGLPNADKLRKAYEFSLKETEEDQKQATEEARERKAEEQRQR